MLALRRFVALPRAELIAQQSERPRQGEESNQRDDVHSIRHVNPQSDASALRYKSGTPNSLREIESNGWQENAGGGQESVKNREGRVRGNKKVGEIARPHWRQGEPWHRPPGQV